MTNYAHHSHRHCFSYGDEQPPCGIKLEDHKQCCLCDLKPPSLNEGGEEIAGTAGKPFVLPDNAVKEIVAFWKERFAHEDWCDQCVRPASCDCGASLLLNQLPSHDDERLCTCTGKVHWRGTTKCHQSGPEKPQEQAGWEKEFRLLMGRVVGWRKEEVDYELEDFIRSLLLAQKEQMLEVLRGMKRATLTADDEVLFEALSHMGMVDVLCDLSYNSALSDVEEKWKDL